MKIIQYNVPIIKQGLKECTQASASQLLNYYGLHKTVDEIKKEVPVYISKAGKPLGSSIGHIATYFIKQGFIVTMHVVDLEIFDRSWTNKSSDELIQLLSARRKFIKHHRYDEEAMDLIFDGYITFLKNGGKAVFPIIDQEYIVGLLEKGPIYAIVNWNFLNTFPKGKFNQKNNDFDKDSIEGTPSTHAMIIAGHKDNKFLLADPDKEHGGSRWINSGHLLGSIYLAETDYDSLLITLNK